MGVDAARTTRPRPQRRGAAFARSVGAGHHPRVGIDGEGRCQSRTESQAIASRVGAHGHVTRWAASTRYLSGIAH